jgi:predicted ribosome quality control (RQC) complex YloA/Tae2 family protein
MNFDTVQLSAVAHELTSSILGARIDKVSQPEPLELVIGVYNDGTHRNLLICADPGAARIHLIKRRTRTNPITAPAFCMLLRKYIDGGVIQEIAQPLGFSERVLRLRIGTSKSDFVHLWVEIMGRQSNIILTSPSGVILGPIKRVTPQMSRLREVKTGLQYTPPPKQLGYKREPLEPISGIGLPEASIGSDEECEKWLTSTFRGVGSLLAKEVVLRRPSGPSTGENLWFALNDVLNIVRTNDYAPVVYRDDKGRVAGAYPFPLKSISPESQEQALSMSDALEFAFGNMIESDAFEKEKNALVIALRRARKAAERQAIDVQEGLLNADSADFLRENGELLLANVGRIAEGKEEATIQDFYSGDLTKSRTVALDPLLTINENAQRYFRKFQKARDSRETLLVRQTAITQLLARLDTALEEAQNASSAAEITNVTKRVGAEFQHTQQTSTGKKEEVAFAGHKIKRYRSADGWEILVGENSTSNDYLTTKVASPSDIWLHARAVPSAHAVIRTQNRPASVSTAALLLAAEQVAKRSSAKHARLVSVDYTLRKYVRKPRGSAPGQVTYTNEKTLDVVAVSD